MEQLLSSSKKTKGIKLEVQDEVMQSANGSSQWFKSAPEEADAGVMNPGPIPAHEDALDEKKSNISMLEFS